MNNMTVGIIAALLALLGTGFSAYMNYRSLNENNDLQQRLANQANQWQVEQRDYENWFNSPSGLQSRGLNPSLAMSAAGGSLAQSANAGAANLPSDLKAPQLPDFGQSIAGANSVAVQNEVAQSQIELNNATAQAQKANAARTSGLLPYEIESMQQGIKVAKSVEALNSQKVAESLSHQGVNEATAKRIQEETIAFQLENKFNSDTYDSRVGMLLNQEYISDVEAEFARDNAIMKIKQAKALVQSYQASATEALANASLAPEKRAELQEKVNLYRQQERDIDKHIDLITQETKLKEKEVELKRKYGDKQAQEEIKRLKQQRVSGYINSVNQCVNTACNVVNTAMGVVSGSGSTSGYSNVTTTIGM